MYFYRSDEGGNMAREYKEYNVKSFNEYLDIILKIPAEQFALFRGQPIDKTLLPKIARYNVPDVEHIEREMLEEFRRRSLHILESQPGSLWDWMALAQHHGMATRLLDWSENPLIALWFSMSTGSEVWTEYSVVWGFHVPKNDIVNADEGLDPFEGGATKVFKPNHIIRRISAQFAWFTIHKQNEEKKFVPFEKNEEYSSRLFKIIIQKSCFAECRKRLHSFGINSAMMYPDIDGLAKHVEWLFLGKDTQ